MVQVVQVSVPEGFIDFGIGQPHVDILPLEHMARAAAHRLDQGRREILQYGTQQGDESFRITLAAFLTEQYGVPVQPDHLFITAGISLALEMICTLLTRPGDTILVEEPSYFLALRVFADHNLNIVTTPVDQDGLVIEPLQKALSRHRPVFLYTIPTFHNPAGVTLPADRREALLNLSEEHDFLIVADEVYHLLAYRTAPPPPLAHYDTTGKRVLSLGSFSKILAPGLRLGWMHASPALLEPFIVCGFMDSGGGLNPFVSSLVHSVIELGLQHDYLAFLRQTYNERLTALSRALRQQIPALAFADPDGGYFIWSHLPEGADAEIFLPEAQAQQVAYQPGIRFSSTGGLRNYLRFCFAFYGVEDLQEGVRRLARVIT